MSQIVHIKSRECVLAENTERLVEFLSNVLPRRPLRDRRGRLVRGARGGLTYSAFRLVEGDYSTLVYHVNQCRMAAGLDPIEGNVKEED